MIKAILLYSWLIFHPVHISLSSIDYSKGSDSFKVFLKMFYDDFLLDSGRTSEAANAQGSVNYDSLREQVAEYLENKFMIYADQKKLDGRIEDLKLINGEVVINMKFDVLNSARGSITVKNLIMTSLYDDQANMMIVKVNDIEEGLRLTPEKTEHTFTID